MPWMLPAAIIGSSLLGGEASADAASSAANASSRATEASIAEQRRQFDLNRADMAPWLTAGTESVNQLAQGLQPGGQFASATPFNFQYDQNQDPGYAFRLSEGMKALERTAAARGGLLSGNMLKGAQRYGQDMASQEYQNAFNRYTTGFNANTGERNALYNRLAGVSGTGQVAGQQLGAQGANMASNIGNAYMNNAANQGNAMMSGAAARQSAYGGAANMLGRMYGSRSMAPSYGYSYTPGIDSTPYSGFYQSEGY